MRSSSVVIVVITFFSWIVVVSNYILAPNHRKPVSLGYVIFTTTPDYYGEQLPGRNNSLTSQVYGPNGIL